MYVEGLSGLSFSQLRHGFRIALEEFIPGYGIDFPAPAQLRSWALEWKPEDNTRKYLGLPAKPDDWEPGAAEKLRQEVQEKLKAGLFQVPNISASAERMAGEANGKSSIPENAEDRAPWAKRKAKGQGWA